MKMVAFVGGLFVGLVAGVVVCVRQVPECRPHGLVIDRPAHRERSYPDSRSFPPDWPCTTRPPDAIACVLAPRARP